MNINIEQINNDLSKLSIDEWAQCVQAILDGRKPSDDSHEPKPRDERYFLGCAMDSGEGDQGPQWDISVVARSHDAGPKDIGLAQGGVCDVCKSSNISNSKHARCGVCLSDMYLT